MTQAEKLEALVRKAIENGWQASSPYPEALLEGHAMVAICDGMLEIQDHSGSASISAIIFNHDFARALFGEECHFCHINVQHGGVDHDLIAEFQYHLQQAVISNDPIGYMYKEVFGD